MIDRFLAAWRFLTVLPIPGQRGTAQDDLARCLIFFPLVGVGLGLLLAVTGWLLWAVLPALPAAALLVSILAALTGGLHLDGLADSADGLFSARPREEMLAIMRDSHIGSMGVVALVLVLVMKTAALASLPQAQAASALFLMPIAGRCLMIFAMAHLPYSRGSEGRAALFYDSAAQDKRILSLTAIVLYSGCWYAGGGTGLMAGIAALSVMFAFALLCRRRLGGATGDTLGATCELTEATVALVLSAGW